MAMPSLSLLWAYGGYAWQAGLNGLAIWSPTSPSRSCVNPWESRCSRCFRGRWVVERTFAWIVKCRRLDHDDERLPETSEAMIKWAMIGLMVRITRAATRSQAVAARLNRRQRLSQHVLREWRRQEYSSVGEQVRPARRYPTEGMAAGMGPEQEGIFRRLCTPARGSSAPADLSAPCPPRFDDQMSVSPANVG